MALLRIYQEYFRRVQYIEWCQVSTTACSLNSVANVQMAQNAHTEFIHISVDVTVFRFLVYLILYLKQVKHKTCIKE